MLILGIESSCDETAASVAEDYTKIRSNVVASQVKEHQLYGGVVPEIASRRHCENVLPVVQKALDDAQVTLADLDGIAVTYAPGLIGALLVGVNFAKGLALATGKPLVPVHHLAGHIAANYIAHPELKPPYLCLVASGGHSHIVEVLSYTEFRLSAEHGTMQLVNVLIKQPVRWAFRIQAAFTLTTLHRRATQRHSAYPVRKWREIPMISAFPA